MITLKQSIEIMNRIKDNDLNNELDIFVEDGHFVIQERLINLGKANIKEI